MAALLLLLVPTLLIAYITWYYLLHVPRYPAGPRPLPLVGNLLQLPVDGDLRRYMIDVSKEFGPAFTLFLPQPMVVLANYESIRESLAGLGNAFDEKVVTPALRLFAPDNGGVLFSSGESSKEQREISLQVLHQLGMGKLEMEPAVTHCVHLSLIQGLDDAMKCNRERVNVFPAIQLTITNVVNNLLFGYTYPWGEEEKPLRYVEIIRSYMRYLISPDASLYQACPWLVHFAHTNSAYKRMNHSIRDTFVPFIRSEVSTVCANFEASRAANTAADPVEPTNFVECYLAEMALGRKPHLTMEHLVQLAADFWLGGMDSTVTTLRWAVLYLTKHPEVQERVFAEVEEVVGLENDPSHFDHKRRMPYTSAFIAEVQRLPGAVNQGAGLRIAHDDQIIAGHHIPANTNVLFSLGVASVTDSEFTKPLEFNPNRWLMPDGSMNKRLFARLSPFGMGRRICAGQSLAEMELFMVVAALVQRYKFYPAEGEELDTTPIYGITLYPKQFYCRLERRVE